MKFILFVICLLLFPGFLYSQTRINEYLTRLIKASNDSEKVDAYKKIIIYYSAEHPDSAAWYASEALNYASQRNYPIGEAKILAQLSVLDENQGRIDIGKERALKALQIFRSEKRLAGVAEMTHNLGSIEASKGNYNVAVGYFLDALKVYDSVTDNHGLLLTYMNLGNLYVQHKDTTNAWKYLRLAEQISKITPLSDATVFLHNTIGVMYAERGEKDKALEMFTKAFNESDKPALVNSHVESLLYLGEFYSENGDPGQAIHYLQSGLATARTYDFPEMAANMLMEIAKIEKNTNVSAALDSLEKAKDICTKIQSKSFLAGILEEISNIYETQGKFKEALAATREKEKLNDSLFSIDKSKAIANINASYQLETNQRIRQLEILNKHNATQKNELSLALIFVIVILGILLVYYRKTQRLNTQLANHEKQLEELNAMKDKLFSVIGHDLRGPIARIPAILDIIEDPETTGDERKFMLDSLREHTKASLETFDKLLYWGRTLVKGISLQQKEIQCKGYISESIELRKMKAKEKNIAITDYTPANTTVYSDASIFDFVVRNLLANALKYTPHSGTIQINADSNLKPGFTVFSVKDSGIGIDKKMLSEIFYSLQSKNGTDNEKGHGIGLMLCKEFAIQNGGDLWVESEPGKGATFYFSVKSSR